MSEKIFLEKLHNNGAVFVSDARIMLSGKTYSTANVTSVSSSIREEQLFGIHPIVIGIIVAIAVGIFVPLSGSNLIRGVFLSGALGYVIANKFKKNYYIVSLGSASGENEALQSENQNMIAEIVESINQAIIYRSTHK